MVCRICIILGFSRLSICRLCNRPTFRKLNLNGTGVSLKALTKLLLCCGTLESLNLTSCRALPRGMKRMYHNREDVEGLSKDIADGKFDPKDAGSDDDC